MKLSEIKVHWEISAEEAIDLMWLIRIALSHMSLLRKCGVKLGEKETVSLEDEEEANDLLIKCRRDFSELLGHDFRGSFGGPVE